MFSEEDLRRLLGGAAQPTGKEDEVCRRALEQIRKREKSLAMKFFLIAGSQVLVLLAILSIIALVAFIKVLPLLPHYLAEMMHWMDVLPVIISQVFGVLGSFYLAFLSHLRNLVAMQLLILTATGALILISMKIQKITTNNNI